MIFHAPFHHIFLVLLYATFGPVYRVWAEQPKIINKEKVPSFGQQHQLTLKNINPQLGQLGATHLVRKRGKAYLFS